MKKITFALLLSFCSAVSFAQMTAKQPTSDAHTLAMQKMMWKLVQLAPLDFKSIKGAEANRNSQAVFYKADLTKTVTDPKEMKEALASNFFGAMLTTQDYIVETGGSTLYMAQYKDDGEVSICDMVTKAFIGLPAYIDMGDIMKVEEMSNPNPDVKTYQLTTSGISTAKWDYSEKQGKGQLIIGLKK